MSDTYPFLFLEEPRNWRDDTDKEEDIQEPQDAQAAGHECHYDWRYTGYAFRRLENLLFEQYIY